MTSGKSRVLLSAAALGLPVLLGLALAGGSANAGAAGSTLHFFSKNTLQTITNSTGTPIASSTAPAAGDVFESSDLDYVGTHTHHAKSPTASDHLVCSLTDATGDATCFGEFAIGGSLLYADGVSVNLAGTGNSTSVPLSGGTGEYQNVTGGTVVSKEVGKTNNSDVTITLQ
jgi:hypothetical protein